jgi:hypothetical protein
MRSDIVAPACAGQGVAVSQDIVEVHLALTADRVETMTPELGELEFRSDAPLGSIDHHCLGFSRELATR